MISKLIKIISVPHATYPSPRNFVPASYILISNNKYLAFTSTKPYYFFLEISKWYFKDTLTICIKKSDLIKIKTSIFVLLNFVLIIRLRIVPIFFGIDSCALVSVEKDIEGWSRPLVVVLIIRDPVLV